MTSDAQDRRLLDVLQEGFPISPQPYAELGERLGLSEADVLDRVKRLHATGRIRGIGPIFDLHRLGYVSTLCAAQVEPERLEEVADRINSFAEVTHNYQRDHAYNLWFTVIAPSQERLESIVTAIRNEPGVIEAASFPSEKTYKIRVRFDLSGGQ